MLISSLNDIDKQVRLVRAAAERAAQSMRLLLANEPDGLQILKFVKFKDIGHHPTDDVKLTITEQANLTFVHLTTLEAAKWVIARHPEVLIEGLEVNIGTQAGFDLQSVQAGLVAAKVFSAAHPKGNNRLGQDMKHLSTRAVDTNYRYVFFSCPGFSTGRHQDLETVSGIEVWSFPPEHLLKSALKGSTAQEKPVARSGKT